MKAAPNAKLDDGLLDVIILNKTKILTVIIKNYIGREQPHDKSY